MLRGRDVSRIEGFSDAVFGFALTLLVVSLEVPENFADLQRILSGFPAFAATFTLICWIWFEHYLLFRRYALSDGVTVVLNCVLLFIVVFYAYPMKFLFTRLISGTLLGVGPGITEGMNADEAVRLMAVYSAGFVAMFGTLALLHWHAWRQRDRIGLDALGAFDARAGVRRHLISVTIGMVSIAMALALPVTYLAWSGLLFALLGPAHGTFGYLNGRRRDRLRMALERSSEPQVPAPVTTPTSAADGSDSVSP